MTILDPEETLLRRVRKGDTAAQRDIYRLHVRGLAAACSRYVLNSEDVKDIIQESFMKIFSSLPSFSYQGPGSLQAWMTRIVLNETMRFMKRDGRLQFTELSEQQLSLADREPSVEGIPSTEIYRMIRELPSGYRTIFNLYVIEGKSHKEISQMLGIKENTSASQYHRAKALLASKIKNYQSKAESK